MSWFAAASRRAILRGLLGTAAAALTAVVPSPLRAATPDPLDAAVMRLLPHRSSARAIGRAYIAVAPEENSLERLRARLGCHPDAGALAEQVRSDFAAGRVVIVEGWTLSLTEARACALVALS